MVRALGCLAMGFLSGCLIPIDAGEFDCHQGVGRDCPADAASESDAGMRSQSSAIPNVMIVLDTSGSMNNKIDPASVGNTPTRISETRNAFHNFLQLKGAQARFGLTTFPSSEAFSPTGCAPPTGESLAIASTDSRSLLATQAQAVDTAIQRIQPTGGTPTAATLSMVRALSSMQDTTRPRAVILVTDGLANCNTNNPLSCTSMPAPPTELCTIGPSCVGSFCRAGYLDRPATEQAVRELRLAGIRTAVVTVGGWTEPGAKAFFNSIADEGGVPACSSCDQRFFIGPNEAALFGALSTAFSRITE